MSRPRCRSAFPPTITGEAIRSKRSARTRGHLPTGTNSIIPATTTHTGMEPPWRMLVKAAHSVRIAAGIRLPIKWSMKSSWYDDWYGRASRAYTVDEHPSSAAADTSEYFDGRFSYHVTVPMQVDAGVSWVVRGITLSAEANRLDWSRVETNLEEPEYRYRSTVNWRMGAETTVPFLNLFLRAGYASMPDPYTGYILRSERVVVEDLNRRDFLTLGAGFLADKNTLIDFTFIRGFWSAEESPRTDESTRMKLLAAVSWRM